MKKRIRRPSVQELNSVLGVSPGRSRRRGVGKFTKSWLESVKLPPSLMLASSATTLYDCLTPNFTSKNAVAKGDGDLLHGQPANLWAGIDVTDVSPYGGTSLNRCDGGEGDPPALSPCPHNPPTTKCAPEIRLDIKYSAAGIKKIYPSPTFDGTVWHSAGNLYNSSSNPTGYLNYATRYYQLILRNDQYCNLQKFDGAGGTFVHWISTFWDFKIRLFVTLNAGTGELKLSVWPYAKRLDTGHVCDAQVHLNPCCYIYRCCPC